MQSMRSVSLPRERVSLPDADIERRTQRLLKRIVLEAGQNYDAVALPFLEAGWRDGDLVTAPAPMRGMWLWIDGLRSPGEAMVVWCPPAEDAPFLLAEWRGYPVRVCRRRTDEGDITEVLASIDGDDVIVSNETISPREFTPPRVGSAFRPTPRPQAAAKIESDTCLAIVDRPHGTGPRRHHRAEWHSTVRTTTTPHTRRARSPASR